jgi:hypothetical protein
MGFSERTGSRNNGYDNLPYVGGTLARVQERRGIKLYLLAVATFLALP